MEPNEMPIPGWGVDRDPQNRPGYPLEQERRIGFDTVQGVPPYTTTVPLKGLSGLIRRAAYRTPDWKPRRWMMLLVADRVDMLEIPQMRHDPARGVQDAGLETAKVDDAAGGG